MSKLSRKEVMARYYARNKGKERDRMTKWRAENKGWFREYQRNRMQNSIHRLAHNMRCRIGQALRNRSSSTQDLIGCTYQELHAKLEAQFLPGMTWENYGEWHVDHRIPLASASTEIELQRLCHWSNLQPLWAADNLSKRCSI